MIRPLCPAKARIVQRRAGQTGSLPGADRGGRPGGSRQGFQRLRQADQVVGGRGQGEGPADQGGATEGGLGLAGDDLGPGERLLGSACAPAGSPGSRMSRGPAVDARARPETFCVTCGMAFSARSPATRPRGIVGTVGTDRDPVPARDALDQCAAAARSARPVAWVSRVATTGPSGSPSADGP